MRVLVTGGAGYIGAIVAGQLIERGEEVVVFDNLQTGHRQAVHPDSVFIQGDLADSRQVEQLFEQFPFDAVMHFAANTLSCESMGQPLRYIGDNVSNAINLLRSATEHGIRRFILSSTANLFDHPRKLPISEDEWIMPGSPYGESKYLMERMLYWTDRVFGMRYASLRYFNPAGALPNGERGEDHNPESHLIPRVLRVAMGQQDSVEVFGTDYPTPDGTCVRDYIHVLDLAEAHLLALHALEERSHLYNLGNGRGFSVREVIQAATQVTGQPIPFVAGPRRPGDPAVLIADSTRARRDLGWQPKYPNLRDMIETAWNWHRTHPNGYDQPLHPLYRPPM